MSITTEAVAACEAGVPTVTNVRARPTVWYEADMSIAARTWTPTRYTPVAGKPRSVSFDVTENELDAPGSHGLGDPVITWKVPGIVSRAPVAAVGFAASAVAS